MGVMIRHLFAGAAFNEIMAPTVAALLGDWAGNRLPRPDLSVDIQEGLWAEPGD